MKRMVLYPLKVSNRDPFNENHNTQFHGEMGKNVAIFWLKKQHFILHSVSARCMFPGVDFFDIVIDVKIA